MQSTRRTVIVTNSAVRNRQSFAPMTAAHEVEIDYGNWIISGNAKVIVTPDEHFQQLCPKGKQPNTVLLCLLYFYFYCYNYC